MQSTINAYVRRALTHCSTWDTTHKELERLTQVLVNNGYKNSDVSEAIKNNINKLYSTDQRPPQQERIKLFYKNHMSSEYRTEERIIKNIIERNVKPTNPEHIIELIIYYKTRKTSQLFIKNNSTRPPASLQVANVIYKHQCTAEDCGPHSYVGMTTTTLSRRLTCHLQSGAIKEHYHTKHQVKLTRQDLESSTIIIDKEQDHRRLRILEAIYIEETSPAINLQIRDLQILPTQTQSKQLK